MDYTNLPSPAFIIDLQKLEKNLKLLKKVQDEAKVEILLALKGFATYHTFDLCKQYLAGCSCSGLNEAKLSKEYFNKQTHTYSPAFKPEEIDEVIKISDHIVFNSFNELDRYKNRLKNNSVGIRLNPQISTVKYDMYNPCGLYSRFGIIYDEFKKRYNNYKNIIEGFHFHALCEQGFDELKMVFDEFEKQFGSYFKYIKWLNLGGGHHITKEGYKVDSLIAFLKDLKRKYPHIHIYLEPGEAIAWDSGVLLTTVLDIIKNKIDLAIVDSSVEAHIVDAIIMPFTPEFEGAKEVTKIDTNIKNLYRIGSNTCLSGDIFGDYVFNKELKVGDKLIIKNMAHYTMVKTTTFNGINLPAIVLKDKDKFKVVKEFGYSEFKSRL